VPSRRRRQRGPAAAPRAPLAERATARHERQERRHGAAESSEALPGDAKEHRDLANVVSTL
jgi:hypothetical protein